MLGKLGAESVVVSAALMAASESAGDGGDGLGPCGADWVSSSTRTTIFHSTSPGPSRPGSKLLMKPVYWRMSPQVMVTPCLSRTKAMTSCVFASA